MKKFTNFEKLLTGQGEIRKVPGDIPPELSKSLIKEILGPIGTGSRRRLFKLLRDLYAIADAAVYVENLLMWDSKAKTPLRESGIRLHRAAIHVGHSVEQLEIAENFISHEVASGHGLRQRYFGFSAPKLALKELEERIRYVDQWVAGLIHPRLMSKEEEQRSGKTRRTKKSLPSRTLDYTYADLHPDQSLAKFRRILTDVLEDHLKAFGQGKVPASHMDRFISEFLGTIGLAVSPATVKTMRNANKWERESLSIHT